MGTSSLAAAPGDTVGSVELAIWADQSSAGEVWPAVAHF